MPTIERELALQAKMLRCERAARAWKFYYPAKLDNKLMTIADIDILARLNDKLRERCGGPNLRYFRASDNWLSNLNR